MLTIIILTTQVFSQEWSVQTKLPWYQVEQWEVDVCSKWGGRTSTQQAETFQLAPSYGEMTTTLQARKIISKKETLYELTYSAESYTLTTSYTIKLVNTETGATHSVAQGNLGPDSGTTDYWTQTLTEDYNQAVFEYARGSVKVPIVEVR